MSLFEPFGQGAGDVGWGWSITVALSNPEVCRASSNVPGTSSVFIVVQSCQANNVAREAVEDGRQIERDKRV
jgi:hypothetical protein